MAKAPHTTGDVFGVKGFPVWLAVQDRTQFLESLDLPRE